MKRAWLNFTIDMAAAIFFLGMLATGFILRFPLPPGTQKTHILWGLTRHEWGTVHTWLSFGLIAILLIHVAQHWSWISGMIRSRFGRGKPAARAHSIARRTGILALAILIGALVAFGWAAFSSVRVEDRPDRPRHERLEQQKRGIFEPSGFPGEH